MKVKFKSKKLQKTDNQPNLYNPSKRLLAIMLLVAFLFCAVFGKLFFVMIIESSQLQAKGIEQWMRDLPTQAPRGDVLDRNGNVLATTNTRYNVYVRPNSVSDKAGLAKLISSTFGYSYDDTLIKISKKVSEVTVAKSATKEQMMRLFASGYSGIYYSECNLRYYPYGDFMTQILGFTNFDGDGQTGLESYYNKYLTGVDGKIMSETDLIGRDIFKNSHYLPPIDGMNLVTTLDKNIQQIVDYAINIAIEKFNPKGVACVVMDYTNGGIVALSEYPSFDLNNVPRDNLEDLFMNSKSKIVSTVFEPGSTFKILTSAAALDKGVITTANTYYCSGSKVVDGKKIRCWKTLGHGSIDFGQGVEESCNCVFMDGALKLGTETFYDYLYDFGLKSKSGIDIQGETSGIFINKDIVKPVDLARIGFGQAVAVTPIGLLRATSAVINDGKLVTPHVLDNFSNNYNDITIQNTSSKVNENQVISSDTSKIMRELLQRVVSNGSGKGSYIPGYPILGKTGTAQKYKDGIIDQGKYISSFLGFSVVDGAEYGILFMVDEPEGYMYYGSLVAAPLVGEIFKGIFSYLNISPVFTGDEKEICGDEFSLDSYVGMSVMQAKIALQKLGLHIEVSGEGKMVSKQFPEEGVRVDKRNTVLLITD